MITVPCRFCGFAHWHVALLPECGGVARLRVDRTEDTLTPRCQQVVGPRPFLDTATHGWNWAPALVNDWASLADLAYDTEWRAQQARQEREDELAAWFA